MGSSLTTGKATVRFGKGGHAGVQAGQRVSDAEPIVTKSGGNDGKKFSQSVHTQEVTGSSPVVSTTKTPEIARFPVFLFVFRNILDEFKLVKNA